MANQKLADAILAVIAEGGHFKRDDTGEKFEAVTETDLMRALRDKGWNLPAAGFFLNEVKALGFQVRQGHQFSCKVRRAFANGTGRALSHYQTIIYL